MLRMSGSAPGLSTFLEATATKAEKENISPTKLYAFGLKQNYLIEKKVAQIGKSVFQEEEQTSTSHMSLQVASAVFESGKMIKCIYTDIRLLLKGAGADVLLSYGKLDEFRKERRPEVKTLEEPFQGVKYDYVESLKIATSQLLKSLELPNLQELNEVHLTIHDGLDGSGGHSIFNQKGSAETHNIIMYMFRVEKLKKSKIAFCETEVHHKENRKTGDYQVRKGVTQDPITTEDMNNLHPLHNLLRCFGWIFKICYHATTAYHSWSEANICISNHASKPLEVLKQAKMQIQAKVKEETSLTLEKPDSTGHGGTSTTGNTEHLEPEFAD